LARPEGEVNIGKVLKSLVRFVGCGGSVDSLLENGEQLLAIAAVVPLTQLLPEFLVRLIGRVQGQGSGKVRSAPHDRL
jgi:hypothetical protein